MHFVETTKIGDNEYKHFHSIYKTQMLHLVRTTLTQDSQNRLRLDMPSVAELVIKLII
jgi:hypothetical protein